MTVHRTQGRKKQSLLGGALWLVLSMAAVKIIGAVFKIPLTSILGPVGKSYFSTAYNLFIPVYQISLAGLPVAISRTVSEYVALNRFRDVRNVLKASKRIFFITGIIGTLAVFLLARPFVTSTGNHNAVYAILVIAPSVFFCCLSASYRGYYNGMKNMIPSAASEVIEALGKLLFGLAVSKLVIIRSMERAVEGNNLFGLFITGNTTQSEIMSAVYPIAAAGGIFGVTAGTVLSTVYLMLRHRIKGDIITSDELALSPRPETVGHITEKLLSTALPIVASTVIFNLVNLIDSWSVQNRLDYLITNRADVIGTLYHECLGTIPVGDWQNFLYGAYETAVDFRNLIPAVTVTLGVSAVPVLSEAWTLKNRELIRSSAESVLRICMMISLPAGFITAVFAKQILGILYFSSPDTLSAIPISSKVMAYYGMVSFMIALSQPLTYMLQSIGKTRITVISASVGAVLKVIISYSLISVDRINIFGAVIGTAVCCGMICSVNLIALIRYSGIRIDFVSVFFKPLFAAVLCSALAWSCRGLLSFVLSSRIPSSGLFSADNVSAVFGMMIAVSVYVISLFLTGSVAKNDIKMLPKGEKICKVLEKYSLIG